MRRIAGGRAEKAVDRLENATDDDLAEAIHGARKDLKKLRAVLRLTRKGLGEKLFKAENRRYRDAGRLLSRSRDAEVKLATLGALRSHFGDEMAGESSQRWEEALALERDEKAGVGVGEAADEIAKALEAIKQGRERIHDWPLGGDSWKLVEPGLSRAYREGRLALRETLSDPGAESVHEWRKRTKDLWYQLRIVRDAWPELLGATADQAHELADLLGDHHDLALLAEDLEGRRDVDGKEAFAALIERRQEELLSGASEIGGRLYAEKPKAFSRRLGCYWSAWRGA